MDRYVMYITVTALVFGVASLVAYSSYGRGLLRIAGTVLTLYAVLSPLISFIREPSFPKDPFPEISLSPSEQSQTEVAKEAFAIGVRNLITKEFDISKEDVTVELTNFDFSTMSCELITVTLGKGAVTADHRAIKQLIEDSGLGKCRTVTPYG